MTHVLTKVQITLKCGAIYMLLLLDVSIKKSHSTPLATSTISDVTSFEEELQHYCDMAINGLDNISNLSVNSCH